jgi:glycosyltransferase involved in cell wall biosynthesis
MIDIVIPVYKNQHFLRPALESIEDQDFSLYEVFVIVDGKDSIDNMSELKKLKKEFGFTLKVLETNQGASAARNIGANMGENKYILFLDVDCVLFPGMLRECIETLEEADSTVAFVYGDYRFEYSKDYYSRPFNRKALETMNYVCTMSPLRRQAFEAVGGFDEELRFFQDWSLFYRIVKLGYIGQYIPEFLFSTALPTEESISGSQGMTLAEKSQIFRERVGLEDRNLVVTTLGAPLQAENRANFLDADYAGPSSAGKYQIAPVNLSFDNWKATYTIGMYNFPIQALHSHLLAAVGRPIFHLIGTDMYQLLADQSTLGVQEIKKVLEEKNAALLVNSKKLKKEADLLGLDTKLVYTPMDTSRYHPASPLPEEFTVAVYYSDNRNMNFFDVTNPSDDNNGRSNVPLLYEVARSMPTVKFKFFGGSYKGEADNIEFCGKIPYNQMPKFISSCSLLVRSTIHDGLPQLPIQFLLSGRRALVSYTESDLKGVDRLSFEHLFDFHAAKEEVISKIYKIREEGASFSIAKLQEMYTYYTKLFDMEKYRKEIYKLIPKETKNA